nr:reverse transcriptase domain-containing protein [Tanacetum cinerariifolium]
MNIPISSPVISSKDVFEEPLIVKAEVKGYLVRRVYVDEGSSVVVMFEHCFKNLNPRIKDRLRENQTDLVGFAGETRALRFAPLSKEGSPLGHLHLSDLLLRLDLPSASLEAYASTELPKGETGESYRKMSLPFNGRDTRPFRNAHQGSRRDEFRNSYRGRDAYRANRARDDKATYLPPRGEYNRRVTPVLTLNCFTKHPKEILATETQLRLSAPRPMLNPLRSGNADR